MTAGSRTQESTELVPGTPAGFYQELTRRNGGFVSEQAQEALRRAHVLVAGCGSTGGAAVEPLVRLGVQRFSLADNGEYELNNLNRQNAFQHEIGKNKAEVCADRVHAVNPHALVDVHTGGIQADNVGKLVGDCDVIIDGVDVTERSGWVAKYLLHESAARYRRPVITGWDMAGTQYVRCYDYRKRSRPFAGRINRADVDGESVWTLMHRAIPNRFVPVEMVEEARRHLGEPDYSVPQVVYASLLFGAIASRMTVDVLGGRPVRRHVAIDVHGAVRPRTANVRMAARKPVVTVAALRELAARRRQDRRA